jgi:thiol:disulfide interchange protein
MKTWQKVLLILLIPVAAISAVWIGMAYAAPELPASLAPMVDKAEKQDRKLVLLLTGSAWCPACQELEKKTLATPEWQTFAAAEILFETFDYPADRSFPTPAHGDLTKLPGFRGYPTFVVADASGKLLALRDGAAVSPADLIAWIRSL